MQQRVGKIQFLQIMQGKVLCNPRTELYFNFHKSASIVMRAMNLLAYWNRREIQEV